MRLAWWAALVPVALLAYRQYERRSLPMLNAAELAGQRALVVGGTAGIGRAMALYMAQRGAAVTIMGRAKADAESQRDLQDTLAALGPQGAFMPCDASLVRDVRRAAAEYAASRGPPDVLVLSPGIATLQGRTETPEGLDVKLALHYFSRVAFVDALGPALEQRRGRVLFVLSAGMHAPYDYADDFELRNNYGLKAAADAAGFYTDCAVAALAQQYPAVRFVHAAPGFVATRWGTELPAPVRWLGRVAQLFARSADVCAAHMARALWGAETGAHLATQDGEPVTPLPEQTPQRVADVWRLTRAALDRIT